MPRRRSSGGCGGGGSFGRLPDAVIGDVFDFLPLRSLQNVDCCSLFLREVVRRYADDCAVQRRRAFGSGALSLPWMITSDAAPTILAASPRTRKGGVRGGGGGGAAARTTVLCPPFLQQLQRADSPVLALRKAEALQLAVDRFLADEQSLLSLLSVFQKNTGSFVAPLRSVPFRSVPSVRSLFGHAHRVGWQIDLHVPYVRRFGPIVRAIATYVRE